MKHLFLAVTTAVVVSASVGCSGNNSSSAPEPPVQASTKPAGDSAVTLNNVTVEEVLKPSDEHFMQAVAAFEKHDNKVCSEQIMLGEKSFKKEMEGRKGSALEMSKAIEKKLAGLDKKVALGEVHDVAQLKNLFRSAEHINRHQRFTVIGDLFVPEKKAEFRDALNDALKDLEMVSKEKKEVSQREGAAIVKKGHDLLAKLDKGVTKKEVDSYILEVNSWLEKEIQQH